MMRTAAFLAAALTIVAPALSDTPPNRAITHPTVITKPGALHPKQVVKKPPPPCNSPNHQCPRH